MERDRDQLLTASIEDVLFRSPDGQFCVLRAHAPSTGPEPVILVGDLRNTAAGETLRVRGRYEQHPSFGRRFRVESYSPVLPTTADGIARYLGSGLIEGIGGGLAKRLVERFGDKTLEVITIQSGRLREVPGIGAQRAEAIASAVRGRLAEAEVTSFLQSLGLGPALSARVRKRYGEDTARVIREDPYLAAEQVAGIGFRTADAMARALGFSEDDPRRAAGAALHLVARAADSGHSFLPMPELANQAQALNVPRERLHSAIGALEQRGLLRVEGTSVYAPPLYAAEVAVAARLRELAGQRASSVPASVAAAISDAAREAQLAAAQHEAVTATFECRLLVVTGGPGTGKTTTVRAIVQAHLRAERRIRLCAPTGRAAKRLSEASGHDAHTIHRLLEWNPGAGTFARNRSSPLEADLVLVDEASMLDVQLAQHLLDALPRAATLILVGDADQLPPVGAGPVLRELLASEVCRVVRLTEVFRQAASSTIVRAAHQILHGQRPTPSVSGTRGPGDLFVVRADQPEQVAQRLKEALGRVQAAYGLDPIQDVQVLTPMRRGPLGTEALNKLLQDALNPAPALGSHTTAGFRAGDKVMQLKNDYEREVWNGDLGTVQRVDAGVVFVDMQGRSVSYEPDALGALSLAYACTVHKVQGSEFPAAIVVLHRSHHLLLTRPLIYTALTRARRLALVIGDDSGLMRAVRNAEQQITHTRLATRMQMP
jgi:exodeoxyribonuclease V alpha subunit